MLLQYVFLYFVLIYGVNSGKITSSQTCFSDDFLFGTGTSAYQTEGAWNADGKGENIWDYYTHNFPKRIVDHSNGDVASAGYYKFKEDIIMLKRLGVAMYRFSISWSRILPTGQTSIVNEDAIKYYDDILDELKKRKIMAVVTMYHWDLPQRLQDIGGWSNPLIIGYFVDYARLLLSTYASKVKMWITFNEPRTFCHGGYGGLQAPGGQSNGFQDYLCGHNVLLAHGLVYRLYNKEYQASCCGGLGIAVDVNWLEPASCCTEDQCAAEKARQFMYGWFLNPIFSEDGDYPGVMRQTIDCNSKFQGFQRSRLPWFSAEEVELVKGSYDFLAINHFTTWMAKKGSGKVQKVPTFENDMNVHLYQNNEWPRTNSSWIRVVPWGLRKALNWVSNTYNNPLILVSANGISTEPGPEDDKRVRYIDAYLRCLHTAVTEDGCNVMGYIYWSFMDGFEWLSGYSERFGLVEINYKSNNFTRIPRSSYNYYGHVAETGCLPNDITDFYYFRQ